MDASANKTAVIDAKNLHLHLKLGVSGAAETGHCGPNAYDKGIALGVEIAKTGAICITGATTGFPLWVAMGAKQAGGFVVGFSPASSEKEHIEEYNLPIEYHDIIVYTGFGYSGRDLIFTRSVDGMFFGCGRIGTIHEFTIALEDNKPIGVYEGEWPTDEEIKTIVTNGHRPNDKIVFGDDPKEVVAKVIDLIKKDQINRASFRFNNPDKA